MVAGIGLNREFEGLFLTGSGKFEFTYFIAKFHFYIPLKEAENLTIFRIYRNGKIELK